MPAETPPHLLIDVTVGELEAYFLRVVRYSAVIPVLMFGHNYNLPKPHLLAKLILDGATWVGYCHVT